jgi:diaminopimelate epimerase
MRFVKMHGLGNDYVYVNTFDQRVEDPAALARAVSDRHLGIGSDGLILVGPTSPDATDAEGQPAEVRMRMFNADGSEGQMCGNGIRCVAKLAHDDALATGNPMRVQTACGVLSLDYTLGSDRKVDRVTVDMGEPILEPAKVPVDLTKLDKAHYAYEYQLPIIDRRRPQVVDKLPASFVSMGNPHAIIFHDHADQVDLPTIGPGLERLDAFPERINVHLVKVHNPTLAQVWHWERGSGTTLACGTGACAVVVAGVLSERLERQCTTRLPGGDLHIEWRESDNHVYMTGPAVEVFRGDWAG